MLKALPRLKLKKGKEKPLLQRHHWIYSGAVASFPEEEESVVLVETAEGKILGQALLNKKGQSIAAHMIAFGLLSLEEALLLNIKTALKGRKLLFDPQVTNAVRLINAEGDFLPGLIVDQYADLLVVQFSHPALEPLKDLVIDLLIREACPRSIYEKSTSSLRKKGGMKAVSAFRYGPSITEIEVIENGLKFLVPIEQGQKTGLFLDQREMRSSVRSISKGLKVLNGFGYTGGFSIAALAGGALHVDTVDISSKAAPFFAKNLTLNHLPSSPFITQDMFTYLREHPLDYDLVILDPPAFAQKKGDINAAFKAYKELNQIAFAKMKPGSLLLSSSCSYYVDESLFQNILFRAALAANRTAKIISSHRQAFDHPISLFHPESRYLKSLLLYLT